MIKSSKSSFFRTFGILNPPFIKTPVLCLGALAGVFVCVIVFSVQFSVSQADSLSPSAVNTYVLQHYRLQFATAAHQIVQQVQLVQKQQTQLAVARVNTARKLPKIRQSYSNSSGTTMKSSSTVSLAYAPLKEGSHVFYAGQCTRYVASKKTIPWGGNAGQWLDNAAAQGYETSDAPKAGAIVVTNESRTGHVAIVEEITGDKMVISEMNYTGWGKVSKREIPLNSNKIKGYITDNRVAS